MRHAFPWVLRPGMRNLPLAVLLVMVFIYISVLFPRVGNAQGIEDSLSVLEVERAFQEGMNDYHHGDYERAARHFHSLVRADPSMRPGWVGNGQDEDRGTAAYWLGRAYAAQDRSRLARMIWSTGVRQGIEKDTFDVRSADAYIRSVFRDSVEAMYEPASNMYLLLLEAADRRKNVEKEALQHHVAQMQFLLPEQRHRELFLDSTQSPVLDPSGDGGHELAAWWRGQDPMPATRKNERVIEHLRRVSYSASQYLNETSPSGFDDRGRTYVRLGAPTTSTRINFDSAELLDVIRRVRTSSGNNLVVSSSTFADNEFWIYEREKKPYSYLFVESGNGYRIGGVNDLIPQRLVGAMDENTGRGGAKTDVVLEAIRTALRQLSLHRIEYGSTYNELARYLGRLNEMRSQKHAETGDDFQTASRRSDNSALMQESPSKAPLTRSPDVKARKSIETTKKTEAEMARDRRKRVPNHETRTLDELDSLPVAVRIARFLEENGTTSTRIYWGLAAENMNTETDSDADTRLVNATVRHMASDYRTRQKKQDQYLLKPLRDDNEVNVSDNQLRVSGDTEMYHLALQWDQYAVESYNEGSLQTGRHLRSGIVRVDSVRPLSASKKQLEMSDLVPVLHSSEEALPTPGRSMAQPFPFTQLSQGTPLALYFELYHLRKGAEDRTRYTVEYELHRRAEQGSIERLLHDAEEQRTTVSTTRTGSSRKAKEYILLNLRDWKIDDKMNLTVTVRVTDKKSGQKVERSTRFQVVPSATGSKNF